MFQTVAVAVGSNLGDRELLIQDAIGRMHAHDSIEVLNVSELIETEAVSHIPQPSYLNGAVSLQTILSPHELLEYLKKIEMDLGRKAKGDYGPRPIDLDIIFYGSDVVCTEDLTIPHPFCHEREFVLQPLNAIMPQFMHPVIEQTVEDLYKGLLQR